MTFSLAEVPANLEKSHTRIASIIEDLHAALAIKATSRCGSYWNAKIHKAPSFCTHWAI
jgi:hypothetical protein